jgi:hypothetical protein
VLGFIPQMLIPDFTPSDSARDASKPACLLGGIFRFPQKLSIYAALRVILFFKKTFCPKT